MGSVAFETKRTAKEAVCVWTVHLHFPAFLEKDESDFYWSTGDNVELEDGNVYVQKLRDVPRGRHQRDRGNDYAEFAVANPENALYTEIEPYEDLIEKGEVTIRECYEIEPTLWESEIKFFGYLKDFVNNTQELELTFTAFADTSRPNHFVGNRILTRERCGTNFNTGGTILPYTPGVPCTWQITQGGNPNNCTKFLKGVDGCEAHNNTHQFYAVEGYKVAAIQIITSPGDETGFPYESGPCFTDRMFMVMDADFNVLPFNKVRAGMKHLAFDIYDHDRLIEAEITWGSVRPTDHFYVAQFDLGSIETAGHHPFYIGDRLFTPVAALNGRSAVGLYSNKKPGQSDLNTLERVNQDDAFYEFHSTAGVYIVCDEKKRFFYFVHNTKPQLPNQY